MDESADGEVVSLAELWEKGLGLLFDQSGSAIKYRFKVKGLVQIHLKNEGQESLKYQWFWSYMLRLLEKLGSDPI